MVRLLTRLLILLALAAPLPVFAGEVRPPIDPEHVARLLLSADKSDRDEGRTLLLVRIGEGGDLARFLEQMTEAQARIARAGERAQQRQVERARPQGAIPRPSAPGASAKKPGMPAAEAPSAEAAGPKAVTKAAPGKRAPLRAPKAKGAVAEARVTVLTADLAELSKRLKSATERKDLERGKAVVFRGPPAEAWLAVARAVPEARRLAEGWKTVGPSPLRVVEPERIRYRRGVRFTKKGAWALDGGDLPRGLSVDVSVRDDQLVVVARHAQVPLPMPVTRVRPASEVEPVEIDRPEWRVVANEARTAFARDVYTVLLPGVVSGQVVVVGVQAAVQAKLPRQAASSPKR